VVVEIAHSGGCCVGVGELCKSKALWSASLFVVDEAEVVDLSNATECFYDELLGSACEEVMLAIRLPHAEAHSP
jgi:hypothetical protein